MIRTNHKEPYQGLKKSPLKRKPFKRKPPKVRTAKPRILRSRELPIVKKRKGLTIRRDPLDELFSLYIRTRDNFTCQRCGVKSKNVQCAHFHSRRKIFVRWDEDNAVTLCMGDHLYLDGNPLEKVAFFQNRLGQVKFDLLNSRARITFPRPDKKMLTLYYQQQIKKLDNIS
jgi:hypothetical protein